MIEELKSAVSYDPHSGKLTWLPRDLSASVHNSRWNTRFAGKPAFSVPCTNGYMKGGFHGKTLLAHRVAWAVHYGKWPDQVDHINGDKTDNRLCNLREVTASENLRNCKKAKDNTSGHIGVYWEPLRRKWRADITTNRKTKCLGRFNCITAAMLVRKAAEIANGFHPNHGRT